MFEPADVCAIVVTHDSEALIGACLAALAAEGVTTVVVDNNSKDRSRELAAAGGAHVIASERNEGYGRANNMGARATTARFLLICNPDVSVGAGSVRELLLAAGLFPDAGLWAPLIVEPDGRRFVQPRSLLSPPHLNMARQALVPDGPASLPFVSGACFLIERELFLAFGGFDPNIFLFYEDDDLCRRLFDAGRAPLLHPAAQVGHLRGRSSPVTPARRFRTRWHMAWSQRYICKKYGLGPPGQWSIVWNTCRAAFYRVTRQPLQAARYGGSVAGARAFARGITALANEDLQ